MICVCAPLFCRRSLLVGTNRSAVDHLDVAVVCSGDGVHHPIPYTRLPPPHEAVVAGSARAKPLWQITPRRAGSQHPKNAVQHAAIIDARQSARLVGQKRRDHAPFEVGQVISDHAYAESDFARQSHLWVHGLANLTFVPFEPNGDGLLPSLHGHYTRFVTTTKQSVPSRRIVQPRGWSRLCLFPRH